MFSDTHCHFLRLYNDGIDIAELLKDIASKDMSFVQDIGTKNSDLKERVCMLHDMILQQEDFRVQKKIQDLLYFSAGIWPSAQAIQDRDIEIKKLEKSIDDFYENSFNTNFPFNKLCALGECGLDHHWNPSGVDGRRESDFTADLLHAEEEFFEMQIELAEKKKLPVIVHSRDAFEETYECIKNSSYHNGVIHCYSYGIEEAKKFLDLGWYISFSGSVTYTKKTKMEAMRTLLRYVPNDRILCETDAPYLAPVPHRGKKNNSTLVEFVYHFIADARNVSVENLSQIVYDNAKNLFMKD